MFRYTLTHNVEGTYVLPNDPKGWEDASFTIARSAKYSGMNYSQIVSLAFICGSGKEFIDNIYNNYGIDEEINIIIEDSCECDTILSSASYSSDYSSDYERGGSSSICDYETVFTGILDLKSIVILDEETQVPLIEQGLNQKFISRADTKISLFSNKTIDGVVFDNIDEPYTLNLHSKAITALANYEFVDYTDEPFVAVSSYGATLPFGPIIIDKDGKYFISIEDDPATEFFFNSSGDTIDLKIKVNISGGVLIKKIPIGTPTFNTSFGIRMGADAITSPIVYNLVPDQLVSYTTSYTNVDLTCDEETIISVPNGSFLFIGLIIDDPVAGSEWLATSNFSLFTMDASYESVTSSSTCKAQKIFESIAKVSQGVLGIEDPVRSSYYGRIGASPFEESENGCGSFSAITSGTMIRKYPTTTENAYGIDLSTSELFDSLDAIDNIGVGFEKYSDGYKLRWERKDFFFQDIEIIHLEHVPDIRRSVAKEYAFNNISIGFEKWQTTSANGLDEYCAKSQYTNGLKSIDQTLEKLSPIIASAYILEEIRRMPFSSNSTTDTDFDNSNFIIALNRELGYDGEPIYLFDAEKDENFSNVENVLSPETAYNLRFTTSKNLLRNIGSISPIITNYPDRNVKFTSGEGNKFIITADTIDCPSYYDGANLAGNQDISWVTNVEEPLYVAEYLEFDYPISKTQFLLIKDAFENPNSTIHNGYITISNESETFKGFLIQLDYRQKDGLSKFKLIRKYD